MQKLQHSRRYRTCFLFPYCFHFTDLPISNVSNSSTCSITGSPSSKYEHRRASALFSNIQNIRICMGKKTIVSGTYENERISIKNSLPYLKCVLRLSCLVHRPTDLWPLNGFLCLQVVGIRWGWRKEQTKQMGGVR